MLGGVLDELAFWPTDTSSASPDVEVINAVEKGSANIPSAMLLGVSSPYSRAGALWESYEKHYGKDNSDELVWKSDSRTMNPTLSQRIITRAYEKDSQAAAAEYGGEFRSDLANFLTTEAIAACVVAWRYELAPRTASQTYYAFVDPSGGSSDSMTLAIAHQGHGVAMLDLVREVVPPFSPEQVVKDFSADAKRYGCYGVTGDRWGAEWVVEAFEKNGVMYTQSEKVKADIYLSLLPAVNSRQVELLDHKKLLAQLAGLERRTRSGGKDLVDHRPGGLHDDVANAAAGALVLVAGGAGEYGLLDYDQQVASGGRQELRSGFADNVPVNEKIAQRIANRAAELKFATSLPGVKLTEQQGGAAPVVPPCPSCNNPHTTRIGPDEFHCACGAQWGTPEVMTQFDRADVFSGAAPGKRRGHTFMGWR
jgi:hypothetical protein